MNSANSIAQNINMTGGNCNLGNKLTHNKDINWSMQWFTVYIVSALMFILALNCWITWFGLIGMIISAIEIEVPEFNVDSDNSKDGAIQ